MPTLYANQLSQPARSCAWFVEYAGLKDVDVKMVDLMKGEQKAAEYVAKFPAGQVPAMEDGDFCFAESTAILPYLADGHALLPKDKQSAARLQENFARHRANARKMTLEFVRPILFAKTAEEVQALVPKQLEVITPVLEQLDATLSKTAFILGAELSLADFLLAPEVDQLAFIDPAILEKYTNITKYLQNLRDVPGYSTSVDTAAAILKGLKAARGF